MAKVSFEAYVNIRFSLGPGPTFITFDGDFGQVPFSIGLVVSPRKHPFPRLSASGDGQLALVKNDELEQIVEIVVKVTDMTTAATTGAEAMLTIRST